MYGEKIHIHIENSRSSHEIFIATQEHVEDLLRRNADIAESLHITIGNSDYDEVSRWSKADLDEYYRHMKTADLLVGFMFPTENVSEYAPHLKSIQLISSGVDHLAPFAWLPKHISLVNARGVHLPKSGESFGMFLVMLNSEIPRLVTNQREGKWENRYTTVIKGKTLSILGIGNQGGEMARQAKKLGLYVIGIHPRMTNHPDCDEVVPLDGMKSALSRSDFFVIAAPLTNETRGMVNGEMLSWLPKHAGLINIARGGLLDHEALHERLSAGELSGAIIDVAPKEPLPSDSFLWNTPNLIILPHVSSDDLINYMPLTLDIAAVNARNLKEGLPFKNIVDVTRQS